MPDITNTDTVTITTPSGEEMVANPLLTFSFLNFPLDPVLFPDSGQDTHEDRLSHDPHTLRMPTGVAPDRVSNPGTVNANLNNGHFMENTVRSSHTPYFHSPKKKSADLQIVQLLYKSHDLQCGVKWISLSRGSV